MEKEVEEYRLCCYCVNISILLFSVITTVTIIFDAISETLIGILYVN